MKRTGTLRVAGLIALALVIAAYGYTCAVHTVDVIIYRQAAQQVLNHDYNIYLAVADGGFRYAPVTVLLFVPLAFMPAAVGAGLIYLFNIVAVFGVCAIVLNLLQLDRRHFGKICGLAFLAAGGYLAEELRSGNVHFLVFALIVVSFFLVERGQKVAPALFLALAIAIKISPILFLFYFVWKRQWRLSAYVVGFLVILLVLPAIFVGAGENAALLKGFTESAAQRLDEARSQSLRGVLFRLLNRGEVDLGNFPAVNVADLPASTVNALWYLLTGASLVSLAVITGRTERTLPGRMLEYALIMTAILVLSPHSLRIYFSTLFFPFAVLLGLTLHASARIKLSLSRSVLTIAFVVGTLVPLVPGRDFSRIYQALSPHFVMAVGLCVVLAGLIRGESTESQKGPERSPS